MFRPSTNSDRVYRYVKIPEFDIDARSNNSSTFNAKERYKTSLLESLFSSLTNLIKYLSYYKFT